MQTFWHFGIPIDRINEHLTSWNDFILAVDLIKFNGVTTGPTIWNDCSQFFGEAVTRYHFLGSDALNFFVFIFGGNVANGYELYAFLIAVRNIDEHRAEVTHTAVRPSFL